MAAMGLGHRLHDRRLLAMPADADDEPFVAPLHAHALALPSAKMRRRGDPHELHRHRERKNGERADEGDDPGPAVGGVNPAEKQGEVHAPEPGAAARDQRRFGGRSSESRERGGRVDVTAAAFPPARPKCKTNPGEGMARPLLFSHHRQHLLERRG